MAVAQLVTEFGNAIECSINFRHHVDAVDFDSLGSGAAQRRVQYGAIFGDVDLFAVKHVVNFGLQAGGLRKIEQGGKVIGTAQGARKIAIQPGGVDAELFDSLWLSPIEAGDLMRSTGLNPIQKFGEAGVDFLLFCAGHQLIIHPGFRFPESPTVAKCFDVLRRCVFRLGRPVLLWQIISAILGQLASLLMTRQRYSAWMPVFWIRFL